MMKVNTREPYRQHRHHPDRRRTGPRLDAAGAVRMDRADDTIGTTAQVVGIEPEQGVSTVAPDADRPGEGNVEARY